MHLSIVNCPDKGRFRPFVKRAALFYADQLMTKSMLENIHLRIKFDAKLDVCGYASVEEYNVCGKAREFLVEINPHIGAREILDTLAHEMVHVKQYAYSETNENLTRWKGQYISEDVDYYDQPWEVEAYGMAVGLFTKFAIKEKLWEVFPGVNNPETPIEKKTIEWINDGQNATHCFGDGRV
jgi:hypothetical protein